jgi:hypothetical protein
MMIVVLLAFVLPWLAAYMAVRWAWPLPPTPWRMLFRCSLATGLALGLSSLTFFLWLVVAGPQRPTTFTLEFSEFVVFGLLLLVFRRGGGASPRNFPFLEQTPAPRLRLAFGVVLVCALGFSGWYLAHSPHGDWDAWAIWNLRARFLYRGGEHWTAAFSPLIPWTHPDYPLLVPAAVARGWTYAGHETTLVPRLIACLFGAATVGLLMSVLALLRNPSQGYLGGLVLLATPYFLELTTAQYADVPLGFFFLASAALFEIHDRGILSACPFPLKRERIGMRELLLAGTLTGLAAWTKNEGSLFLAATALARLLAIVRHRDRALPRELAAFSLGLLPVVVVLIYFKLRLAPVNDLVAGQGWRATRDRLMDGQRYALIAGYFLLGLIAIGPGTVVVLAGYHRLLGRSPHEADRRRQPHALTVLVLMLAGYAAVYLTTPNPLGWHLHDSVHRLFMQLWPTALLAFFLGTATPEETREPSDGTSAHPAVP